MSDQTTNPPTMQPTLPAEPASWPGVIGTVSIIWGSLGLLCNSCGLIMQLAQPLMINMAPPEQRAQIEAQQPPPELRPGLVEYGAMISKVPLAAILLAAGIALVRRRLVGRTLHLVYSWMAIGIAVLLLVATAIVLPGKLAFLKEHPQTGPGAFFMSRDFIIGATVFGTVIVTAWPIFCLIWFLKVKRDPGAIVEGIVESEEAV